MSKWTVVELGFDCFALVDPNGTRIVAMSGLVGNDRLNAIAARLNAADEWEVERKLLEESQRAIRERAEHYRCIGRPDHARDLEDLYARIDAALGAGKQQNT